MSANTPQKPLRAPAPLPRLHTTDAEANAAWLTGWWSGKVTGFALGFAVAVIFGLVR